MAAQCSFIRLKAIVNCRNVEILRDAQDDAVRTFSYLNRSWWHLVINQSVQPIFANLTNNPIYENQD